MNEQAKKTNVVAFLFDTGKINSASYGEFIFMQIIKGREVTDNLYKIVYSHGDIFNVDIYNDITPFAIYDEICTVKNSDKRCSGYIYAVMMEDIETGIAIQLDKRLRSELDAYIGITSVDIESKDPRKQFWKSLIRKLSIESDTITCFGFEDEGTFFVKAVRKIMNIMLLLIAFQMNAIVMTEKIYFPQDSPVSYRH